MTFFNQNNIFVNMLVIEKVMGSEPEDQNIFYNIQGPSSKKFDGDIKNITISSFLSYTSNI